MKIVFFHDHKIIVRNRVLYSSGGMNQNVVSRYLKLGTKFSLATRETKIKKNNKLSVVGNLDQVSFYSIPDLSKFNLKNYKSAYKIISEIIQKNDFIIIRLPSIIGLLAVYLAKKKYKKYLIESVGCAWDSYRLHSLKGKLIAFPMYYITKYFIKTAPSILYVTKFFLQSRYPSKTKHKIACSDVEIIIDSKVLNKRIKKISLKSKEEPIRIGMIGSLEAKYKGFETAFKALSLLKHQNTSFILEIVGSGSELYINNLKKKYGLQNNIKIIGTLPHPEPIFSWLDSVDIYLHPSSTEGLPRALIEAMSRGCACLGSNVGGISELIEKEYLHKIED